MSLAASIAERLRDPSADVRESALEQLEALYVGRCESGE
jgi:hypothetical protein